MIVWWIVAGFLLFVAAGIFFEFRGPLGPLSDPQSVACTSDFHQINDVYGKVHIENSLLRFQSNVGERFLELPITAIVKTEYEYEAFGGRAKPLAALILHWGMNNAGGTVKLEGNLPYILYLKKRISEITDREKN